LPAGILFMEGSMAVEILTIGSEILLGEIADTNTQVIARALREEGFDLQRVVAVGDDPGCIAEAVRSAAGRSDGVIITGGLGPTVDDPTRAAVAAAAGKELVFHPELWESIQTRFRIQGRIPTENNKTQAYQPDGAEVLPNPNGTAPGFAVAIGRALVLSLPGVPSEMECMLRDHALPLLHRHLGSRFTIRMRILHTAGLPESQIDERIGEFEKMENPIVGLAAHPRMTDIRITARGESEAGALERIAVVEKEIRARLGAHVFGADGETLAGVALRSLPAGGSLLSAEWGTGGALAEALSAGPAAGFRMGLVMPREDFSTLNMADRLRALQSQHGASHTLGVSMTPRPFGFEAEVVLVKKDARLSEKRIFLLPEGAARLWAASTALIFLWQALR
jgi:competence/damage-inducible protein CinA-like protein